MPTQSQIRDEVTTRIIQALEADLLPWRRPWSSGSAQPGRHSNVATKRPYQGVNHILLELHAQQHCLFSRWWGTFPMWKSLGCNIRKRPQNVQEGCWGCRIVFYKPVTKTVVDDQTGDEDEERFFVLRTFTVFSADQAEGDAAEELRSDRHEGQTDAQPDFQPAEELILATRSRRSNRMSITVVIFRKDRTGWKDCFALFPELPSDEFGNHCTAYQRVGQHCSADYQGCIAQSDPATPAEYADLLKELERRGYILTVHRRATPEMHERRRRIAAEWRGAALEKQLASVAR